MIRLVRKPIDTGELRDTILRPEDGAVAIFEGVVRDHARGKKVLSLEYHAYEAMALKMLEEVRDRTKKQFPIREIAIVHRLGPLKLKECSVAIVVASAHRAPAFEACRFAIDTIKKIVPIWKREFYEDGEVWIEGSSSVGS
jgi:molybdopterin synthase catalytic subunit